MRQGVTHPRTAIPIQPVQRRQQLEISIDLHTNCLPYLNASRELACWIAVNAGGPDSVIFPQIGKCIFSGHIIFSSSAGAYIQPSRCLPFYMQAPSTAQNLELMLGLLNRDALFERNPGYRRAEQGLV